MTCDHCVHAVTEAAKSAPGVRDAKVRLDEHAATVSGDDIDVEKLIQLIGEEGYEASLV
jgi:copper chaperone CopZ